MIPYVPTELDREAWERIIKKIIEIGDKIFGIEEKRHTSK